MDSNAYNIYHIHVYAYMQAMVYLLQKKFNIEYNEAISCHQDEIYPQ